MARSSPRVQVRPHPLASIADASPEEQLAVSRQGTLAVADMTLPSTGEVVTLASMYGAWEKSIKSAGASWIYADASVHCLISDLSVLVGRQRGHKIIAAGDLNVIYGYGERGNQYWKARYDTDFSRMEAERLAPSTHAAGSPGRVRAADRSSGSTPSKQQRGLSPRSQCS